jgi:uncharacterized protein
MHPDALLMSLFSPMVLAFVVGIIATRIHSDLKIPDGLYVALTIYLLVAIGIKGGYKLSQTPFTEVWKPCLAALALGTIIPLWTYPILRRLGKFTVADAAAIAAHYGSVSAVTFSEALAFHDNLSLPYEGFMPSLLAIMEIPAILIALMIARTQLKKIAHDGPPIPTRSILRELLSGKSTVLLVGFLVVGALAGKRGWDQVAPFFDVPFRGILTLFLLEAGLVTGRRLSDLKTAGAFLVGFGILMPVVHATLAIAVGKAIGLSLGGSTILGVLAASASYIAAPAAVRVALPEASPTYYLTATLAVTFPFNIMFGLPLYHHIALIIFGG